MLMIEQLREKIEQTDVNILELLAARQVLAKQIGELKLKEGKEVVDRSREEKLFKMYEKLAEKYTLDKSFVTRLFKVIIEYSVMIQKSGSP